MLIVLPLSSGVDHVIFEAFEASPTSEDVLVVIHLLHRLAFACKPVESIIRHH